MTFYLKLSPQRSDEVLMVSVAGDVLNINGDEFDFSPLPEGATLPRLAVDSDFIASDVERIDGTIHLTLRLPHGPIPIPQPVGVEHVTFPQPVLVETDGPVALPRFEDLEVSHAN